MTGGCKPSNDSDSARHQDQNRDNGYVWHPDFTSHCHFPSGTRLSFRSIPQGNLAENGCQHGSDLIGIVGSRGRFEIGSQRVDRFGQVIGLDTVERSR